MTTWITIASTAAGAVLILFALRDLFHTVFHPMGRGAASDLVAHATWKVVRAVALRRRRAIQLAGPLAVVMIIAMWLVLVLLGHALIYWPQLPGSFAFAAGLNPESYRSFFAAFALSLEASSPLAAG